METPQYSRHNNNPSRRRRSSIGVDEAPYHAPLAPFEQITADLHATGFTDITSEDLQECRKEKIRAVYAFLLEICAGITEEQLDQRATLYRAKCQEVYQYDFAETLHCNFIDFLFFLELRSIVVAAGYEKFSMRDVHSPNARRLQVILSSMINFCKYREQQIPVYTSLMELRYKLTRHYEELLEEKQGLLEQLELEREEAEQRSTEVEQLAIRCAEMEKLYVEMSKEQSNDRKIANEAKKASDTIRDKIETARWEVEKILEQMNGIEATSRVYSPERKIKLCEERKAALDAIKQEHVNLCQEIEAVSALTHQAQAYQQPLQEIQDLAFQFVSVQEKLRVSKSEEAKLQAKIRDIDKQQLEAENIIEQEERTLARLQYQMDHDTKKDDEMNEDEIRRKRTQALEQEDLAKQRLQELERAYNEMIAKQQAELQEMDKVAEETVDAYCERLDNMHDAMFHKA